MIDEKQKKFSIDNVLICIFILITTFFLFLWGIGVFDTTEVPQTNNVQTQNVKPQTYTPQTPTTYSANKYSTAVYFNQVIKIYEDVANSMEARNLLQSYQQYWTNEDVIELAKHTLVIENSYERVKNIVPPKDLIPVHQEVLHAFELIKNSMPIYRIAIDKNDSKLYDQSMNMIIKAGNELTRISDKFK